MIILNEKICEIELICNLFNANVNNHLKKTIEYYIEKIIIELL